MTLEKAISVKGNSSNFIIACNDKNRGWIIFDGNIFFIYPYTAKNVLSNPKTENLLKKRDDFVVLDARNIDKRRFIDFDSLPLVSDDYEVLSDEDVEQITQDFSMYKNVKTKSNKYSQLIRAMYDFMPDSWKEE